MSTAASQPGGPASPAVPAPLAARRQRNARGQGARLTEEIVAAALALIDRTGTEESVTLRAVAREVGIAAPSIYSHFRDRDEILLAVVARLFDELSAAISAGTTAGADGPVGRLLGGCEQYVEWGLRHPARYSVLFASRWTEAARAADYCQPVPIGPGAPAVPEFGAEAFAHLVDSIAACVEAGASASTDVVADGTAVWVALHGAVTLRTNLPRFPWPEPVSAFVRQLVLPLARVTAAG
jgi:AcrR family transcriptional regulator